MTQRTYFIEALHVETKISLVDTKRRDLLDEGADGVVQSVVGLVDGTTITIDPTKGKKFRVTLAGDRTIVISAGTDGQIITLEVIQDATGTRLITWDAAVNFGSDVSSPTLTTTAAKRDRLVFEYNAVAAKWDCIAVAKGY